MWEALGEAIRANLNWQTLVMIVLGNIVGIIIGALPGLSVTMGMALFSPLTFYMSPLTGIPFLIGLYKGGTYGGSVSAILIGTPGTASNAATVLDGYPMRLKGQAGKALRMAIYASTIGDFFSDIVLVALAVPLAQVALKFGQAELFALVAFSLTMVCYVSGTSLVKGIIAALLGLFFTLMGLDEVGGSPRMTFGIFELTRGIPVIPMVVGIFALSEVMVQLERRVPPGPSALTGVDLGDTRITWRELRGCLRTIVRSCLIGSFIGALPGIGAETSCWVAYGMAKRASKRPEEFGQGCLEGVAAPEAANNAVCGATLVPLLTFGIPGDIVVAVMMGAFIAQGLRPGPLLLQEHPQTIYALFVAMFVASLVMFVVANGTIGLWVRLLRIHPYVLYPVVVVLCVAGSYAINTSLFDLGLMLFFGLLGYVMRKMDFAISPFVLAFVLGPMFETTLRQALLQSRGDPSIFVTRPLSAVILAMTGLVIAQVVWRQWRAGRVAGGAARQAALATGSPGEAGRG